MVLASRCLLRHRATHSAAESDSTNHQGPAQVAGPFRGFLSGAAPVVGQVAAQVVAQVVGQVAGSPVASAAGSGAGQLAGSPDVVGAAPGVAQPARVGSAAVRPAPELPGSAREQRDEREPAVGLPRH